MSRYSDMLSAQRRREMRTGVHTRAVSKVATTNNARGLGTIQYCDSDRKHQCDLALCCHCQRVIFLQQLDGVPASRPGYCSCCHAATCHACATAGGCRPIEKALKASEQNNKLLAAMGVR